MKKRNEENVWNEIMGTILPMSKNSASRSFDLDLARGRGLHRSACTNERSTQTGNRSIQQQEQMDQEVRHLSQQSSVSPLLQSL